MTALKHTFDALTAQNEHTEATIALATALGGPLGTAYVTILTEITDRHELAGHIASNDRTMRDAIQKDLLTHCRFQKLI